MKPSKEDSPAESLVSLAADKTFQYDLTAVRAKALLSEISDEMPGYKWGYAAGRLVRNISAEILGIEEITAKSPKSFDNPKVKDSVYRCALAWESLAKLKEGIDSQVAVFNSAISYELAGYQANASCLARRLLQDGQSRSDLAYLSAMFLRRLFLKLGLEVKATLREPDVSRMSFAELSSSLALGGAAKGLNHFAGYFLTGNEDDLEASAASFAKSERAYASTGAFEESNMVRSLKLLLPVMKEKSTWSLLLKYNQDNPRWTRYLKLLARGPGKNLLSSPSVSELWQSQIDALASGLLESSSKIIKMPTSAGKTRVAEIAMVHTLVSQPGSKCIYIAPYRALVSELEDAFLNLFGDLGFNISTILGSYESDDFEELLESNADILVTTPEKLDLIERAHSDFLANVRLFILDEGQIVNDGGRGVKFEMLLTRLKRKLVNARFLFLSAMVPNETLVDFAKWFNADPKRDVLHSKWRPSIGRYAKFEWRGRVGRMEYAPAEDVQLPKEYVVGVVQQKLFSTRNGLSQVPFPDPNSKSQTAAEIALKFADLGPVLVFCSQRNHVNSVAEALEKRIALGIENGDKMLPFFFPSKHTRSAILAREWLGEGHQVTRFLEKGIAIHHGGLPDLLRKAVETDFRERNFQVLIATNTLAQGVNLPLRTVIVHSCWRVAYNQPPERISARDYWNIAGRAGRAGEETEGTTIHIVASSTDEKDYQYYLSKRESLDLEESALFTMLRELVAGRLTIERFQDILDPEVLALLVEESQPELRDETIHGIVKGSLAEAQAERTGFSMTALEDAVQSVAKNIQKRVPDDSLWHPYNSTGLSTASCEVLRQVALSKASTFQELATRSDSSRLNELIDFFLGCLAGIPEISPKGDFPGPYSDLLRRWIEGNGIGEMAQGARVKPEHLAKFVEGYFVKSLPWGVSAATRIACSVLNLDENALSDYFRFFPSMVKFGVPTPPASWAMAAGMPSRDTARKVAAKYSAESTTPNYSDFLQWIGRISSDSLKHEFGLKSPVLEDTSKAIFNSGVNELLKKYSSAEELLPVQTYVRGISYEGRNIVAASAKVGDAINLVRRYDNPIDRNAIEVLLNSQSVGYIERQLAQLIAVDVDCGLNLTARVASVEKGNVPQVLVRIEKAATGQS